MRWNFAPGQRWFDHNGDIVRVLEVTRTTVTVQSDYEDFPDEYRLLDHCLEVWERARGIY